jgi:Bcr/CflA subfamily drug resistance transporter
MSSNSNTAHSPPKLIFKLAVILMISSIGQVTSDLYLPSLPAMSKHLSVTTTAIQLTIAIYMIGFCLSQLIYGPLSDGIGRRKPILFGLSVSIVGGIICSVSDNIWLIYFGRFLQGLGVGSGTALARSILRDLFSDETLAKYNSYIAMASIVILAIAPILGGYIETYLGWRFNFIFLFFYGLTTLLLFYFKVDETNKHMHPENLGKTTLKKNFLLVLTNRSFIKFSLCPLLTYAGILAWLTAAPIILQNTIGLTPIEFGYIYLFSGIGFVTGGFINAKFVVAKGLQTMMQFGFSLQFIAGCLMLLSYYCDVLNTLVIIGPVMFYMMGSSMVFPNASSGALKDFPHIAGLAGAILGFMQILGGAISSNIFALVHEENQLPMSIAFMVTSCLGVLLFKCIKLKD